ncbi:MAG: TetR/AcrR family transcriptional regulator [Roseitalea porphyridii]|uniref:TetR/AcrR family transcriptional regulator n=1 Tax=Roseitalea porphyridii TaxID=1852022 RepID=UPI0032ED4514
MRDQDTAANILDIARDLLAADGLEAVSFDAIARRLGHSKQAVLYWYPNKRKLLIALFMPWLEAEAETVESAIAGTAGRRAAIEGAVRALVGFHTANLDRFRMMYLVPQTTGTKSAGRGLPPPGDEIYRLTDRLYSALATRLGDEPIMSRRQAVAIHSAAIGLVTMLALADSLHDPLKHSQSDLVDALVGTLTGAVED